MQTNQERIKDLFQRLKDSFTLKNSLVFLFFFIIAAVFWFIQARDQIRETTLKIPLEYTGVPENVRITNELPNQLNLTVRDQGKTLLKYHKTNNNTITIDLEHKYLEQGRVLIKSEQIKTLASNYLMSSSSLMEIKPDSILVEYSKLSSKKLPVKIKSSVKLASQYMLSDSTLIEPSIVKVLGPKNVVDSMTEVMTEKINLRALSDTTELVVALEKPKGAVSYSLEEVKVKYFVEQFTEKRFEKNITIINAPKGMNIKLFPAMVTVIYNVGLSNYDNVNESNIKVVFDYAETKKVKKRRYSLKISNNSPFARNLRISPERVEFLIEEN